ncbi:MAG: response regulator transcription factor [Kiritimatiellae bacterium]|nr:response regulator transcription factor [Kiritimatiellia bacterium]
MNNVRILIADDHKIVRMGLKALVEAEPGFEVVGEAEDGETAVRLALELKPDVVVMDLVMPGMDGAAATAALREALPSAKVVILTSFSTSDGIARALKVGARGAILKTAEDNSMLDALRTVADGREFLSPEIKRLLENDPPAEPLSARQREILAGVVRGLSNADIAQQLGISAAVVREHLSAAFGKLGAANRAEAVAIALRKQLVYT